MSKNFKVLNVGLPNCGKSAFFNALTSSSAKVGNWGGVTVKEQKKKIHFDQHVFQISDLPGFYDLNPYAARAEDEQLSQKRVVDIDNYDGILNIVDASNLSRSLYLTVQLRELDIPMVVVLNKKDLASKKGLIIDENKLSEQLRCPIISIDSTDRNAEQVAKEALQLLLDDLFYRHDFNISYDKQIENQLQKENNGKDFTRFQRCQSLWQLLSHDKNSEWINSVSNARHTIVQEILKSSVIDNGENKVSYTETLDAVLLHPFWGMVSFLFIMYCVFLISIRVGSVFIPFFEGISGIIFIDMPQDILSSIPFFPDWLIAFIASGIGTGIQTAATFIPVITALYFVLGFLEKVGYMPRAAFVVEWLMQKLGLPGKAFVPLIVGFGCNVPSISATRTLENKNQRIMTSMMAPFMSCGARLPVYALFATTFFANNGQDIVFLLYIIGILMAIMTGFFLKHTLLIGNTAPSIMELPDYEMPSVAGIWRSTVLRTSIFIKGAGKIIVLMVTFLSFINTIGFDGSIGNENTDKSVLVYVSKNITPLFNNIGVTNHNWQATVGIITGVFAKEAVVGTLTSLYDMNADADNQSTYLEKVQDAFLSIPKELLGIDLADPVNIKIGDANDIEQMAESFDFTTASVNGLKAGFVTQLAAFSYMLFVLLYTPCVAVLGAVAVELGNKWALFIGCWTFFIAYMSASICFQVGTYGLAAWHSVAFTIVVFFILFICLRIVGKKYQHNIVGDIPIRML